MKRMESNREDYRCIKHTLRFSTYVIKTNVHQATYFSFCQALDIANISIRPMLSHNQPIVIETANFSNR